MPVLDTPIWENWEDQIAAGHTALVLVDFQNDFVHRDGWVATQQVPGFLGDTGIDQAVERAGALLAAARAAGVLRVFVRMIGDEKYLSPSMHALYARNHGHRRPVCVQEGTWGADFHDALRPAEPGTPSADREIIIDKHRYSAFIGTRVDQVLRSNHVQALVVCGVATSGCVESTIRDGFMLDYYVVTAGDACADYEDARHRATLSKMNLSFGSVQSTSDIVGLWTSRAVAA
jgi:ureidoacrylate peracid hydrolase